MHPIAVKEGVEFNLNAMIRMAMEHYTLNPLFDIHVDYWLESLQTFVTSEMPWSMYEEALIAEKDLYVD